MSVLRVIKFLVRSISIVLHHTTIKSKISDTVPISYSDGHDPRSSEGVQGQIFQTSNHVEVSQTNESF